MGKRKGRRAKFTETLIHSSEDRDEFRDSRSDNSEENDESGFFACYLLTSLCPRYKGHTYIGFTVNPRRRIRQHNGELCSGAWRTKKKRPWEMVLCIYGFPTNVSALQFEWAWQHPVESLAVRNAAAGFKSLGGLANKIKLAYTMLTLPAWNNLNLTVNFFSTKYTKHYAGCPTLPSQMRVNIRSMDELPCYTEGYKEVEDDLLRFENNLSDDEEEPEKTLEDVTIPVLHTSYHQNNEEPSSVSDNENYEPPSFTNDLWDDGKEPEKSGGFVSADHHNNKEEAIYVSDNENYEQTSCSTKSPGRLFSKSPKWSYMDSDCFTIVSQTTVNKKSKIDCVSDEDGPERKICGSSGELEVIDLFTPSPKYKANSRKKKRGVSDVCPEIIDLTESPMYV